MSTIKVDTVRPVTADASLTLQGDNSGTGVSGITIDSSGNSSFNNKTITNAVLGSGVTGLLINENSITAATSVTYGAGGGTPVNFFEVTLPEAIINTDFSNTKIRFIYNFRLSGTASNPRVRLDCTGGLTLSDVTMISYTSAALYEGVYEPFSNLSGFSTGNDLKFTFSLARTAGNTLYINNSGSAFENLSFVAIQQVKV